MKSTWYAFLVLATACAGASVAPEPQSVAPAASVSGIIYLPVPEGGTPEMLVPDGDGGYRREFVEMQPWSDGGPPPTPFPPVYATPLCDPYDGCQCHAFLDGLALAQPVDYLELRYGSESQGQSGWRCSHARDRAQCERAYAAITPPPRTPLSDALTAASPWAGVSHEPRAIYLIVEHAGQFRIVLTQRELDALLGPVDRLSEAALSAKMRGYEISCHNTLHSTGQASNNDWLLTVRSPPVNQEPDGPKPQVHIVRVRRNGAFVIERSEVLPLW